MNRKVTNSSVFLLLFFLWPLFSNAQDVFQPSEIKEALEKIGAAAKDTLRVHTGNDNLPVIAIAHKMDSLSTLYLGAEKLAALFSKFNSVFEKVPFPYKSNLKGEARKKWLLYQVSCAISGGQWGISLTERMKPFKLFGEREEPKGNNYKFEPEIEKMLTARQNVTGEQPLRILYSYPADGTYNFYKTALNGTHTGYILFNKRLDEAHVKAGTTLGVRWTNNKGHSTYSRADHEWNGNVFFVVPSNQLMHNTIYKLELVSVEDCLPLKPYWEACCFGGTNFFAIHPYHCLAEWAGVSAPICSIYFRVSKYQHSYDKMKAQKGMYDPDKQTYSMTLDEPFDSLELYGNKLVTSPIILSDDFSSDQYNNLFAPIVANYLVAPRTGSVDTMDVAQLHPFEQAGLYNQDFLYKMKENQGTALATINKETGTWLRNGYTIRGTGTLRPIIRTKDKVPSRITQQHYTGKATLPLHSSFAIVFEPLTFAAFQQQYAAVRTLLQRRVRERAVFFYSMEVRNSKRTGKANRRSLADFERMEKENLSPVLRSILEEPLKMKEKKRDYPLYTAVFRIPGTTTTSSIISFSQE